jgi:hypothetical protein
MEHGGMVRESVYWLAQKLLTALPTEVGSPLVLRGRQYVRLTHAILGKKSAPGLEGIKALCDQIGVSKQKHSLCKRIGGYIGRLQF